MLINSIFSTLIIIILGGGQMIFMNFCKSTYKSPLFPLQNYSGRFLHITDIHFDPDYIYPSSPSKFCHRKSHKNKNNNAGKFGSIQTGCDSPYTLINSTFEFLKKNFSQVDFIIYTGDSCRHGRDLKNPVVEEDILFCHQILIEWFTKYFDPKKVKIIPTFGNNDLLEHNSLEEGPNTLFSNLTQIWAPLHLNLTHNFNIGGYFRQDVNSRLSVLSLNSMYFYKENLLVPDCEKEDSPGSKQLKWIERELINAKEENRKIYISHHVPPLDSDGSPAFYEKCYEKYIQLLGDYSNIIYGHFTGHTNLDTLTFVTSTFRTFGESLKKKYNLILVTDEEKEESHSNDPVVLVLNNAPSIIPVNNPAIREYVYSTKDNNDFGVLLNYFQYFANLTEANNIGKVRWELEYMAKELYGINRLQGDDWENVLREFRKPNLELWERYKKYVYVSR
ncbi:hypothetical protein Glove_364g40 [Diversispora epigaea]|uniref:Uncharacterized protein n=1 Tax=Diversispora epigaea TaxID=1348612 RepID=A0A397HCQ2_9GLOM|nr:hypothetical protein Glove_364g40 [Diversispora epigaea]